MARPTVETQNLTKSCNETLILATLAHGAMHGYQLALEIERRSGGFFKFNHGTLYPILHKLEKDGLIKGFWSAEDGGRKRKSYTLTRNGKQYVKIQVTEWRQLMECFFEIVGVMEK